MTYASYWKRIIGTLIDSFILLAISIFFNRYIPMIGWIISLTFNLLYYPFFWASKVQGTPGKYLMGTVVTDLFGNRINIRTAMIRYALSWISGIFLGFGYVFIIFTDKKQTFHELLAGTVVIDREEIIVEEGLFQAWIDQIKSFSIEALSNK